MDKKQTDPVGSTVHEVTGSTAFKTGLSATLGVGVATMLIPIIIILGLCGLCTVCSTIGSLLPSDYSSYESNY
jgi:hypothetical protein